MLTAPEGSVGPLLQAPGGPAQVIRDPEHPHDHADLEQESIAHGMRNEHRHE